jgi:hypothetical protein
MKVKMSMSMSMSLRGMIKLISLHPVLGVTFEMGKQISPPPKIIP